VDNTLITEEVVEMIMQAKRRMPTGWRIVTNETDYWVILEVPLKKFEDFSLNDRIRIAEATNELCERIKTTGIPCYIEKA
jgi:hypothetical protein